MNFINHAGVTVFDRSAIVPMGEVQQIEVFSSSPRTIQLKVARRVAPGSYSVVVRQALSHVGGGWRSLQLTTPYGVTSADVHLGYYYQSGPSIEVVPSRLRSHTGPDIGVGSHTLSEDTGFVAQVRPIMATQPTEPLPPPLVPGAPRVVEFIIRPTPSGWTILNDTGHVPVGVSSVSTLGDRVEVFFTQPFSRLRTFHVTPDERLLLDDVAAGASGGLDRIIIYMKQRGVAGFLNPAAVTNANANINVYVSGE